MRMPRGHTGKSLTMPSFNPIVSSRQKRQVKTFFKPLLWPHDTWRSRGAFIEVVARRRVASRGAFLGVLSFRVPREFAPINRKLIPRKHTYLSFLPRIFFSSSICYTSHIQAAIISFVLQYFFSISFSIGLSRRSQFVFVICWKCLLGTFFLLLWCPWFPIFPWLCSWFVIGNYSGAWEFPSTTKVAIPRFVENGV